MDELMKFENGNKTTMSSREIAEITGKLHSNVMVDIRRLQDQLGGELTLQLSYYISDQNKQLPMYQLTKEETILLISGYDALLRLKIIRRWAELETKQLPKTFSEALLLAGKIQAEKEQLALKVDNLETALDVLVEWVSIIKVALHNRVHEKKLNWRVLKAKSDSMGYIIKKAESPRYGYQNLYNVNVFKACYPEYDYNFIE
jgi:Rha family phage regulatory protein